MLEYGDRYAPSPPQTMVLLLSHVSPVPVTSQWRDLIILTFTIIPPQSRLAPARTSFCLSDLSISRFKRPNIDYVDVSGILTNTNESLDASKKWP